MNGSDDPDADAAARAEAQALRRRLRAAAHEIRTPLTGAATLVDILAASELATGPTGDYVHLLKDAVAQAVAVANDILDLGRLEADLGLGPREAFAPDALLGSSVGLARTRAGARGIEIGLTLEGLPERAVGHPVVLRRVLDNLLDNAIRHAEPGPVTVKARMLDERTIDISVTDSGPGLAAEDLARLFEPYVQLGSGRRAGGTGLGLALAKAAVERVGGRVRVTSREGEGTTFGFTSPLDPAPGGAGTAPPEAARRALAILVAEDNPVNRVVLGTLLGEFGHRVVFSPDGLAALQALRASGPFDLVLMDIEMPGLDGPATLAAIRSLPDAAGRTPCVAVSARGAEAREEALALGFDAYVPKPIEPAALFSAIEAAAR